MEKSQFFKRYNHKSKTGKYSFNRGKSKTKKSY